MNLERITEEYLKRKAHLAALTDQVGKLKEMLSEQVDKAGVPDDKGHLWLTLDGYLLQRQKRQGDKRLDREAAEQWARDLGIWDKVKVIREELSEDELLGFVFEHRKSDRYPDIEEQLQKLYVTPDPTWAFMPPVVQKQYDY